jgi:autotransporter adhesin
VNVEQLQAGVNNAVTAANNYTNAQIASISNSTGGGQFKSNGTGARSALPAASGNDSSAGGAGAVASGTDSTAVGNNATATAANSVALGQGSTADRANTVSVGAAGSTRQIVNVAAGTQTTDAVNVGQLDAVQAGSVQYDTHADGSVNNSSITLGNGAGPTTIHNVAAGILPGDAVNVGQLNQGITTAENWSKGYTDQQIQSVNNNLNSIGNRANAGVASAIAAASLPQAYQPNQSSASVALGSFHGEAGIAVGLSTISESGRWVYKINAADDSRGDASIGVGAGMVW